MIALQCTDRFVGRTMNWLYDHLKVVPRYECAVLCDKLENRDEFPALQARSRQPNALTRRIWHRLSRQDMFPTDSLWLRRLGPEVLHAHFGYVAINQLPLVRRLGIPWLVSYYGADAYQSPKPQDYEPIFASATKVLALGPAMADRLAALGCPQDKIAVHALGVAIDDLPTKPRVLADGEPMRLLFAGTFREKKGIQYVVEGAAMARKRGVNLELHLVGEASPKPGDRETSDDVFGRIEKLGLTDAVVHHPFVNFSDLVRMALDSHVFVAPSVTAADGDSEGTPFVLQQMMATEMPVIATAHSDIPFLFGNQRHLLVPERDAQAIADRLVCYAETPDRLIQDGRALSEQIRTHFNVEDHARRLSDLYDEATGATNGRQ